MFKAQLVGSAFMPGVVDTGYGMRRPFLPVFDAEGGTGGSSGDNNNDDKNKNKSGSEGGNNEDSAAAKKEAEKLAREVASKQKALETANAQLQELNTKLKDFDGIDPAAVRALLQEKADAEAAKQKAEEDRLKAAGDFEALKKRMADEHQKEIAKEKERAKELEVSNTRLQKQIHELTIGQAFAASAYLRDETLLPPAKARRAYEDHFEIKDGQMLAYDKPEGVKDRAPLVDARGKPLAFDEAIKQIIDADPDRDHLLKSKAQRGSGQSPGNGGRQQSGSSDGDDSKLTGVAAIAAALAKRKGR